MGEITGKTPKSGLNYTFVGQYMRYMWCLSVNTAYTIYYYIPYWFLSEVLLKHSPANYHVRFVTHSINIL